MDEIPSEPIDYRKGLKDLAWLIFIMIPLDVLICVGFYWIFMLIGLYDMR